MQSIDFLKDQKEDKKKEISFKKSKQKVFFCVDFLKEQVVFSLKVAIN